MNNIPVRNEEFIWRNLEGDVVLLNPNDGKYFSMNSVGCSFYEKIDGTKTVDDITGLLLEEFEIDRETLKRDLDELVNSLVQKNIVSLK